MATRAGKQLKQERAERFARIHTNYCERHPDRAREERSFRKEQLQRVREHAGRDRHHDRGTPETAAKAAKVRQGSLSRMYEMGQITIEQLAASQQIRSVAERIGADVSIGTVSLETRVDNDRRHGGAFFERLGAVRAEVAYGRWRESLGDNALPVLAMVVLDQSISATARKYGMRLSTARKMLGRSLDSWSEFMGDVCREIDEADVLAMHAGLI